MIKLEPKWSWNCQEIFGNLMSCQIVTIQLSKKLQLKQPANKENNICIEEEMKSS